MEQQGDALRVLEVKVIDEKVELGNGKEAVCLENRECGDRVDGKCFTLLNFQGKIILKQFI